MDSVLSNGYVLAPKLHWRRNNVALAKGFLRSASRSKQNPRRLVLVIISPVLTSLVPNVRVSRPHRQATSFCLEINRIQYPFEAY